MKSSRADPLAWTATAGALAGFAVCLAGWLAGGGSVDVAWAPTLDLRLDLAFDGLGALYALLATGIGTAVFAYGSAYLPLHLAHGERPATEARRFWPWMTLFMLSMIGLACARDLVLLFVFFDLTAVASYFLIGFDRDRREARGAALMALLVTGVSAVALLLGAVLLYAEYGTFSLPQLFDRAQAGTTTTVACALIAVAALAKSAQVPLHFWLPRAMAAPTPVSAYLHSAAMVAAGVLVLGRVHPLLALDAVLLDGLLVIGLASIVIGGLLALAQDELKQILAHSTISQYGYVVTLYGIGGAAGAGAAALYVITHAIAKSALFMTAGAVTEATGEARLSHLGGLARTMPVLAVASGVAAATLAALPLTLGFFKDELFFAAARERGWLVAVMAVVAAALTFAYIARFWFGLFTGPRRTAAGAIPSLLVAPVVVLAAIALVGGFVVSPFTELANDAATVTYGAPVDLHPAYHVDARAENLMALAAWALGAAFVLVPRARAALVGAVARVGDRVGPRRVYGTSLRALNRCSDRLHDAEVRDLRNSIAAVLVPTGVLVALGLVFTPTENSFIVGPVAAGDLPIIVLLVLCVAAAFTAVRDPGRLRPVLALSVLGFALAAVYAVSGAPDVALVAVLVETIFTLVFVGVFSRLPQPRRDRPPRRRRRAVVGGVVAGATSFVVIWATLSRTSQTTGDAAEHVKRAKDAHGGDVVTVILADFRGLDTMVEITVLAVAIVGVASLLRAGRSW
ncbi:multicomponent Na+:H+ antiporter subunit A [Solirubrobacter pauli]|uniref:Multicomponent Na+:H+ antiporter subunit A n=1 Tax=Solirubrobacter pauli TaxID=166793 RepID=A0A660LJ32_9ACTN|nr:hydrogen gas-evolving membrane-bound hydrogenase subunit E [Solirubrobacter pauli]RKQ93204.1 multicomponent Na+:H+ antiporter subunit A [Solirubrobacter pauli]